jgi:hypothetical protein
VVPIVTFWQPCIDLQTRREVTEVLNHVAEYMPLLQRFQKQKSRHKGPFSFLVGLQVHDQHCARRV